MKSRFQNLSLQGKISLIYIFSNIFLLIVNFAILFSINTMSIELEKVYQENMNLNTLSEALDDVQDSMTEYLSVKTSESLENYYRSEQTFRELIEQLESDISSVSLERMERNIKNMSDEYLVAAGQTIEAKRGRNVEKYRYRYETASALRDYIDSYIYSLNAAQFTENSQTYNELSQAFRLFEYFSIGIMSIVIVGNVLMIISFTGTLIKPLHTLAEQADEVAKGNFEVVLAESTSRDEIGVVTNAFNQMVVSIHQYIERVKESMETERVLKEKELLMESRLKDAQLKYLQAQINPHFLFNTLNAGAQLAMMEGADETYEYVQSVSAFYRYNVKKGNDVVSIWDELELVDNYIYILNVRFSGDIHYEKNIEDMDITTSMPSMILQPIVENCVNHGIRNMAGEGRIWLSVYEENNQICISVRDNGIGMNQDMIERVLNGTYSEEDLSGDSNGIGMDNVIARLKLFTGFEHVMDIVSAGENQGTEFIIYLKKDLPVA